MAAAFAGGPGSLGLFLAAVGLYGVLFQMVTQRSAELAVRIALGAEPKNVRRPVIRSGMGPVLLGLILGIPLALGASSLIHTFLYGIDPADPLTFSVITLVLGFVGFAASYLPARKATRTDPDQVLREV